MELRLRYSGENTAEGMRQSILKLIDHQIKQTRGFAAGATKVKESARYAGELTALDDLRNQVAWIEIIR